MRGKILLVALALFVFSLNYVMASDAILSNPSMCCERSLDGAWCINEPAEKCDTDNFRAAPASCEATSYCKLGTCYDSKEGICYENTPQRVCDDNGGTWDSRPLGEVPQCQLGCCLIADQAAFVPLVRCKKLATYFGVDVDYRDDIESEMACVVLANSQETGACVYEQEYERVCEFTTRGECGAAEHVQTITAESMVSSERRFYSDTLCSAEELNTVCGRQASTQCYQGKVFWYDSCGNRENVYSSDRERSWNNGKALDADSVCSPNDGTDPNCGNCEYMLGSRCEARYGILQGERAFCQRTDCIDRWGGSRLNGESWCVNDGKAEGKGTDKVGSRFYREVCIDGEIRVEPCEDYRNQVCYESSLATAKGEYAVAACRVNRWQACIGITDQAQCENGDKRDCMWLSSPVGLIVGGASAGSQDSGIAGYSAPATGNSAVGGAGGAPQTSPYSNPSFTGQAIAPMTGYSLFGGDDRSENESTNTNRPDGVCVPKFSPGLQFWSEGSSEQVCEMVSARCVVMYEKKAFGDWKCKENCDCLSDTWAEDLNRICVAQGDCGAYVNYIGKLTDSGYEWLTPSGKKAFKSGSEEYIRGGFGTGDVVAELADVDVKFNNKLLGGPEF